LAADASSASEAAGDASIAYPVRTSVPATLSNSTLSSPGAAIGEANEKVAPAIDLDTLQADGETPKAESLDDLVGSQSADTAIDAETECLASAVYFESKGESLAGQLAVARVIINRRDSGRFPGTLCGVVHQPSQFSFIRGGKAPPVNRVSRDWHEAIAIARIGLRNAWKSTVEGALFFHARRASPGWNKPQMAAIDNHIFYR
jgi:spore germination cell wall hydrolase CwlJ-like protein